jgi:hypothetical protein
MASFVNYLLYQLGWLACVLGTAWGFPWLGVCLALGLIGVHLSLAEDRKNQIAIAIVSGLVGMIIDSAQLWAGVFSFPRGVVIDALPPPFMTVLWMQFATTFRYCMSWLSGRYVLSSLFGLIGAPIAFFAGERLGAIEFLPPRLAHFASLGFVWCLAVPLLVYISDRLASQGAAESTYRWHLSSSTSR